MALLIWNSSVACSVKLLTCTSQSDKKTFMRRHIHHLQHFRRIIWFFMKIRNCIPDIQNMSLHLEVSALKPYYDNLHAWKYMIIHIVYRIFVIWPTNTIFRHNTNIQTKGKIVQKNEINIPIKAWFNIKVSSNCG